MQPRSRFYFSRVSHFAPTRVAWHTGHLGAGGLLWTAEKLAAAFFDGPLGMTFCSSAGRDSGGLQVVRLAWPFWAS
jgi:hypothetical protein